MSELDLDSLLAQYRQSTDKWVETIRDEESLATSNHQLGAVEKWEDSAMQVQAAGNAAKEAREAYTDALRKKHFNF